MIEQIDNHSEYYLDICKIEIYLHQNGNKSKFYFRIACRNDPGFSVNTLEASGGNNTLAFIENDQRVKLNYQKIIKRTIDRLYEEDNNSKTIKKLREELIGKLQQSVQNVFSDLILNNIKAPLEESTFYFKKGIIDHYNYKNLSSGVKAALILMRKFILGFSKTSILI